jgi:hypothetical protein
MLDRQQRRRSKMPVFLITGRLRQSDNQFPLYSKIVRQTNSKRGLK